MTALAWWTWQQMPFDRARRDTPILQAVPFTTFPGQESLPAFSPDGTKLAFTWNGEKQGNPDIYTKEISGKKLTRLTTHPDIGYSPVWSPGGQLLWRFAANSLPG
jgi:Tol biopolymer transport system component